LLLVLGVVLFGTAFGIYARLLGWIDGLPQLPPEFLVRREPGEIDLPPATAKLTDAKLRKAFPGACPEVDWKINIELKAKGIVFAANEYRIEDDGRLKLWPFSLATFKDRGPREFPEINTVHCDIALLEFDTPIHSLNEAKDHRLIGVELVADENFPTHDGRHGRVHFTNNRGTPSTDDDLELITPGPVYFRELSEPIPPLDEAPPQIRTDAVVDLIDRQSRPEPTRVTAQGMRVYLTNDKPAPTGAKAKAKDKHTPTMTGVRRVVLPRNVDMNLWMQPGSGFLESPKTKPTAPPPTQAAAGKPGEPTNVQIRTLGPFTYDILSDGDRARFDRLPAGAGNLPDFVRVVRPQMRGPGAVVRDQLECDHLEIQFARRGSASDDADKAAAKASTRASGPEQGASVEWVHAWGAGQSVVLTSDDEQLEARGNDLFHDARTKKSTLTGIPEMVAAKDTHEIHAPELVLYGADSVEGQQAQARGPGYLRLNDKDRRGLARWKQLLIYRKEDLLERITLTGQASFDELPQAGQPQAAPVQSIRGDQIKLALLGDPPAGDSKAAGAKALQSAAPSAGTGELPRRKPKSLEVDGHVIAHTPDMNVTDADHLVMLFTDVPPAATPVSPAPTAAPGTPAAAQPPAAPAGPAPQQPNAPPKKPIEVRAAKVQVLVQRQGDVNQLDSVLCEGKVRVHQDPVTPEEKPVDIVGRTVSLKHTRDGNILDVLGTLQEEARVNFPELSLFGPRVHIDQVDNVADVEGIGGMTLDSQTDFEGKKLDKPAPVLITWKQSMHFDGLLANFYGNVEATQNTTSLLCHMMRVRLTRPVSLAQVSADRKPGNAPPAVETVICGKDSAPTAPDVTITQSESDASGRVVKYQRIESTEVDINKDEGRLHAPGRGRVWLLQRGPKGQPGQLPGPSTAAKSAGPVEEEDKLTLVRFTGSLTADSPKRTVKFWSAKGDFIDVVHMPYDNPGLNLKMDHLITRLPQGAMHLRSQLLTVYTSKTPDGKQFQTMEATGKAFINWQNEFNGWAEVIRFDESKQQMILEGTDDNPAMVNKFPVRGGTPGVSVATKFIYNRLDGSWSQTKTRILDTGPLPKGNGPERPLVAPARPPARP
jgi:lipopolysaccharide export system protein LptA